MSVRAQLWKGDKQIGCDVLVSDINSDTGISVTTDAYVDKLITEIHRGEYGHGGFRIECDHTDERGVFLGTYYRADVTFPRQRATAKAEFS